MNKLKHQCSLFSLLKDELMSKLNKGWQKLFFSRPCSLVLCFIIRRCSSPSSVWWILFSVLCEVDPHTLMMKVICWKGYKVINSSYVLIWVNCFLLSQMFFCLWACYQQCYSVQFVTVKYCGVVYFWLYFSNVFFLLPVDVQTLYVSILCDKTGLHWLQHPWKFSPICSKCFYCAY